MPNFIVTERGYEIHVEHPVVKVLLKISEFGGTTIKVTVPEPQHLKERISKVGESIGEVHFRMARITTSWSSSRDPDWERRFNLETFTQKVEDYAHFLIEKRCRDLEELLRKYNLEPTTINLSDFRRKDEIKTEKKRKWDTYEYSVSFEGTISFDPPLADFVSQHLVLTVLAEEVSWYIPNSVKNFMEERLKNVGGSSISSDHIISDSEGIVWWKPEPRLNIVHVEPSEWIFYLNFRNHNYEEIESMFKNSLVRSQDIFEFLRKILAVALFLNADATHLIVNKRKRTTNREGNSLQILTRIIDELEDLVNPSGGV